MVLSVSDTKQHSAGIAAGWAQLILAPVSDMSRMPQSTIDELLLNTIFPPLSTRWRRVFR
jgi:hypothetical protein